MRYLLPWHQSSQHAAPLYGSALKMQPAGTSSSELLLSSFKTMLFLAVKYKNNLFTSKHLCKPLVRSCGACCTACEQDWKFFNWFLLFRYIISKARNWIYFYIYIYTHNRYLVWTGKKIKQTFFEILAMTLLNRCSLIALISWLCLKLLIKNCSKIPTITYIKKIAACISCDSFTN